MATSNPSNDEVAHSSSAQDNTNPPSYDNIRLTTDAKRLFWTVNGPLSDSIWVMPGPYYDPGASLEPYFRQGEAGEELHPVSQSPLTEDKIKAATVSVHALDDWENVWCDYHCLECWGWEGPGVAPDDDENWVLFGTIPGREPEHPDFPGKEHLLRCCGVDRPLNKDPKLVVEATGEFLTIHDFVSAVHPWLMGLRDDILKASSLHPQGTESWPPETKLMVGSPRPGSLSVMTEEDWRWYRKKHPLHDKLVNGTWQRDDSRPIGWVSLV
ncbi:hypothetical protein VTJ04DRAFT_3869 [Mycothermus thermophilus]|uniref:uncharacterized protein n=1 Tax=Humicola insolens TaxID=85995 RepID=UPI003743EF1F